MPVRAHEASEYLRTPEDVAAYLNAAIEESDGDPRLLMKAFRNVAAVQGGRFRHRSESRGRPRGPLSRPVGKPGPPIRDRDEDRGGVRRVATVRAAGGHQVAPCRGSGDVEPRGALGPDHNHREACSGTLPSDIADRMLKRYRVPVIQRRLVSRIVIACSLTPNRWASLAMATSRSRSSSS